MATKSFYETMVIDTPEAAANLAKAIDDYEQYGAYQPGPTQGGLYGSRSHQEDQGSVAVTDYVLLKLSSMILDSHYVRVGSMRR